MQTNEVTRAIAWRLPLGLLPDDAPVALVDLGCSAGLSLVADRLDLRWIDDHGAPITLVATDRVALRLGLDRAPIDARDLASSAWLRACLWPGQVERHARLDAALREARAALDTGALVLETCDALAMPARLEALSVSRPTMRVLACQTIFAEYLALPHRAAYEEEMSAWVSRHPGRAMWCAFETASRRDERDPPAELVVRVAAREKCGAHVLARGDYHPTSLTLKNEAARALSLALGTP